MVRAKAVVRAVVVRVCTMSLCGMMGGGIWRGSGKNERQRKTRLVALDHVLKYLPHALLLRARDVLASMRWMQRCNRYRRSALA